MPGWFRVMTLAEHTGLVRLLDEKVHIATLIAGMCAGAYCVNDVDVCPAAPADDAAARPIPVRGDSASAPRTGCGRVSTQAPGSPW